MCLVRLEQELAQATARNAAGSNNVEAAREDLDKLNQEKAE
jgi:hypothetical protein